MRTTFAAALAVPLAIGLALVTPASAAGPNGGQTALADGHPIEFVATDTEITFFVADHDGKPLDTGAMNAKAFLSSGGKTETLALKPAAPNRLVGAIGAPLAAGTKVVLSSKLHGHNLQARFTK